MLTDELLENVALAVEGIGGEGNEDWAAGVRSIRAAAASLLRRARTPAEAVHALGDLVEIVDAAPLIRHNVEYLRGRRDGARFALHTARDLLDGRHR